MISYITFYKLLFTLELCVAEFLFTFRLKKRPYFILRYLACLAALMGVASIPIPMTAFWSTSLVFLMMFGLSVAMLFFCYDRSFAFILFCAIAAYSCQHFAYELTNLAMTVLRWGTSPLLGMYSNSAIDFSKIDKTTVFVVTLYLICYLMSYWLLYAVFGRRIKSGADMEIKSNTIFALIVAGLMTDIIVSSVVTYHLGEHFIGSLIAYITNMLCCMLLIACQFNLLSEKEVRSELDFVRRLWQQEKEQYAVSRDNIDIINIKCHDMRHRIRELAQGKSFSDEEIAEIENSISIYDSAVKTGNAALDVILTEKSLRCHANDVLFTCVADGSLLSFMSESDTYSLFGNILDNAIEATLKIAEHDGRTIGLKIRRSGEFVSVNVKNPFVGELDFDEGGLPRTTKNDKNYHGFGIKSITYLVQKYGGDLSLVANNGVFNLNILFPTTDKSDDGEPTPDGASE